MTRSEYQELTDFFIEQLGRYKQEARAFVEVLVESLRGEIRLVADGVLTNRRLIEENRSLIEANGRRIETNSQRIEANGQRIDTLTHGVGRAEAAVSARFADHEERLRALE